jgi:hypothetical protein
MAASAPPADPPAAGREEWAGWLADQTNLLALKRGDEGGTSATQERRWTCG